MLFLLPVFIELSRFQSTYSSAKFELFQFQSVLKGFAASICPTSYPHYIYLTNSSLMNKMNIMIFQNGMS